MVINTFNFISKYRGYILLALVLFSVSSALAHEWYPPACCGGSDCHPVPCKEIIQDQSTRWWQWTSSAESDSRWNPGTHFNFPPDALKPSPDGLCHACVTNTSVPMCIILPPGS